MWWITPVLFIIDGILNSVMDVLRVRWKTCIFSDWKGQDWIDPSISWHTKWEIDKKLFGRQINIIDKIMSTTLVWLTDMWHFAKMLMLICITLSVVFYTPMFSSWLLDVFIFYFLFTGTFEIFFSKVLIKK